MANSEIYTFKRYGSGDRNFHPVTVYDDSSGKHIAVRISNAGKSGSVFYKPDPRLIQAAEALTAHDVVLGLHSAQFAKGVTGNFFYVNSAIPSESTNSVEGSNRALQAVHDSLMQRSLLLGDHQLEKTLSELSGPIRGRPCVANRVPEASRLAT